MNARRKPSHNADPAVLEDYWIGAQREASQRLDEADESIDAAAVSIAASLGLKDSIELARKIRAACLETTEQELMA